MSILLKDITFTYNSEFSANFNMEIESGTWTAIVGDSGAGKTTLLKLIAGILQPDTGSVHYSQSDVEIGFIFQNSDDQILQLSVEKELAFNLENQAVALPEMRKKVAKSIANYNFQGREKSSPNILSGGEKQRLALAATLISEPDVLIFDEPTSFLDYVQKEKLYQRVADLRKRGKTIIWCTHELDEIFFADQVIEIGNGQVVFVGKRDDFLRKMFTQKYLTDYINEN